MITISDYIFPSIYQCELSSHSSDFLFFSEKEPQLTRGLWDSGYDWNYSTNEADFIDLEPMYFDLNGSPPASTPKKRVKNLVQIIPQLCCIYPLPYSIWKILVYLPSITNYLTSVHGISELARKLNSPLSHEQLREAITAKDISTVHNYDLLEFYGDSLLK